MCLGPELVEGAEGGIGALGELIEGGSAGLGAYALPAALASQVAGSYANHRAMTAQNQAQQRAIEESRVKQHHLQEEANQAVLGTADKFDPTTQNPQLQAAAAARTAAEAPAPMPTQGYQTTTASAPQVVQTDQERKLAEALTGGKEAAKRSGALQAFGDSAQTNQIALGRAGQRVGQLANFSQGVSNTLPFQLESAYNHGGNWSEAADILNSAGRVGTLYGLTRKKPGGIGYGTADPAGASVYDMSGNMAPAI